MYVNFHDVILSFIWFENAAFIQLNAILRCGYCLQLYETDRYIQNQINNVLCNWDDFFETEIVSAMSRYYDL